MKVWEITEICHKILFSNKEEQIIDKYNKLDDSLGNYTKWKKAIPEDNILYDYIILFWNDEISKIMDRLVVAKG